MNIQSFLREAYNAANGVERFNEELPESLQQGPLEESYGGNSPKVQQLIAGYNISSASAQSVFTFNTPDDIIGLLARLPKDMNIAAVCTSHDNGNAFMFAFAKSGKFDKMATGKAIGHPSFSSMSFNKWIGLLPVVRGSVYVFFETGKIDAPAIDGAKTSTAVSKAIAAMKSKRAFTLNGKVYTFLGGGLSTDIKFHLDTIAEADFMFHMDMVKDEASGKTMQLRYNLKKWQFEVV